VIKTDHPYVSVLSVSLCENDERLNSRGPDLDEEVNAP
jgi:hypothetical protein